MTGPEIEIPPTCTGVTLPAGVTATDFDGAGTAWLGLADGSIACWPDGGSPQVRETPDAITLCLAGLPVGCLAGGDGGVLRRVDAGGVVEEWEAPGGWIEHLLLHSATGRWAAVTPRGITLFDPETNAMRKVTDLAGAATGAAMRWDGAAIALTHRAGFTLVPWNGAPATEHPVRGAIRTLAWRADGRYLAGPTQEGDLLAWQPADDGEVLLASEWGRLILPCWSADSAWLAASAGERLLLWHFTGDAPPVRPDRDMTLESAAAICRLAWHPLLATLAVGQRDGTVTVIALESGRQWCLPPNDGAAISALAWRGDGAALLAADEAGNARLFTASGPASPVADSPA